MKSRQLYGFILATLVTVMATAEPELLLQPTPDGGTQPRLIRGDEGDIHLLYFKKRLSTPTAREGNLYYRQYDSAKETWSVPVKVSSESYDLQTYAISRAAFDIDGQGRIHALWYLPREAKFFYSRSNLARNVFEPQRSMVSTFVKGIDAGADIAARGDQVAIVWGAGDLSRESERTVYTRVSDNNGEEFSTEFSIGDSALGACACCSLAAEYNADANLIVAYRSAINGIGRHMQLLTVKPDPEGPQLYYSPLHNLQQWELSACPLSTNDIAQDSQGEDWAVFETANRIVQMPVANVEQAQLALEPLIQTRQKNPALAINAQGQRLLVWGEAISHSKGGSLNYAVFDADGNSLSSYASSHSDAANTEPLTIPNYSFPAAAALPDGRFLVLY